MKNLKKFLLTLSIVIIFVFNLIVSFDNSGKIGVEKASAKDEPINYEDKFKSITIGGGITFEICCEIDVTNGCWVSIWPKC